MTTTNWRTNLGGAISVLGTSIIGIGVVPQLANGPSNLLLYLTVTGFVLSAVGKAVTALFAADAKQLEVARQESQAQIKDLQEKVNLVPSAIQTGDTSQIQRAIASTPPVDSQPAKP